MCSIIAARVNGVVEFLQLSTRASLAGLCTSQSANVLLNCRCRCLDLQRLETTELIHIKLDRGDYVSDLTPHETLVFLPLMGEGGTAK